jgi:hypothetical protein
MRTNEHAIRKHTGKVTLPAIVGAGVLKSAFLLKDTVYYQVGPAGDYIQEVGG